MAQGQAPRFGAIDDGALAVRIPRHARKELLAYLGIGLYRVTDSKVMHNRID